MPIEKKSSSLAEDSRNKAQTSGRALLVWAQFEWSMVKGQGMSWNAIEESLECHSESFTFLEAKTLDQTEIKILR